MRPRSSPAGETREGPDHAGFPGITGGRYPKGDLTRIVSAPGHGSWPDLVEGLLSRTARRMLRASVKFF